MRLVIVDPLYPDTQSDGHRKEAQFRVPNPMKAIFM
jgi:hypothetical protein